MASLFGRKVQAKPLDESSILAAWIARNEDELAIWDALAPGPSVDAVASRLSTVPREFLDDAVDVRALTGDALPDDADAMAVAQQLWALGFAAPKRAAAIALWLWASEVVVEPFGPPIERSHAGRVLAALSLRLASASDPVDWVADGERREEAARTFILWSGQLPDGETGETARSLLEMRDSVKHSAALAAAMTEYLHRAEVAKALADARAREAAARYTSE